MFFASVGVLGFDHERRRRESVRLEPSAKTAASPSALGDLVEVDPGLLQRALELVGAGPGRGCPFSSIESIDPADALRRSRRPATAANELAGIESSSSRGVRRETAFSASSPRSLATSISTLSEPGTRLASAVASSSSMPVVSKNCIVCGSTSPPACSIRPPTSTKTSARLPSGGAWRCVDCRCPTSASDSPLGGVDRCFEGLLAFGEDEEVADDPIAASSSGSTL